MKKQFLKACAIAALAITISNTSYGQFTFNGPDLVTPGGTNNVGIDDNTPQYKLTSGGDIGFTASGFNRHIFGNTSTVFALYANSGWGDGSGLTMSSAANGGDINFVAHGTGSSRAFTFWSGAWGQDLLAISKDGKVRIGDFSINTSGNYKLFVETGILTERVKVALKNTADWSDFVFADDYQLPSLNEVETYVKTNKHLPNIPSAEDVVKEGLDLGAMDAKLLQKIEELTLYVIQQQKEIDELKEKLNK